MVGCFRGAAVAGLVFLFVGSGATASPSQDGSSTSTRSVLSARPPSITIVRPRAGMAIHGSSVRVAVRVRGFRVVAKQFQPPVAREGHVHFYLDVRNLPKTHVYPSPVPYRSISGTVYTWAGVGPGRHIVAAQLVGNDHVPLRPQVKDEVTITVRS